MRIGEVAEQTGLSISNIRFYEKKGLIEPDRENQSKYRDYTIEDVKRIKEILLYRKMDFSIETISLIINSGVPLEDVMEQQILDLKEKQKEIQGSIDLCQKVIEDRAFENMNVETYLNYVKEEEAKGKRFANVDELLIDFAEFTQFGRIVGDPNIGWVFRNPWLSRLAMLLWSIMWIAIPVIGVLDDYLKGDRISPVKLLFWIGWLLFFGINFCEFRKMHKNRK